MMKKYVFGLFVFNKISQNREKSSFFKIVLFFL